MLDRVGSDEALRLSQLRVQYNAAMASAQLKMESGDYAGAQLQALAAKQVVDRDSALIAPALREEMMAKADKLIDQINENRIEQERQQADAKRAQVEGAASAQRAADQQKRQDQIRNLLIRVRQLQMELKYDEALQILDEILFMDPNNPAALTLRDVIESAQLYRKYSDVQRRRNMGYGQLDLEVAEANVPPRRNVGKAGPQSLSGSLVYPEDWRQL